jgi:hypothetical protein
MSKECTWPASSVRLLHLFLLKSSISVNSTGHSYKVVQNVMSSNDVSFFLYCLFWRFVMKSSPYSSINRRIQKVSASLKSWHSFFRLASLVRLAPYGLSCLFYWLLIRVSPLASYFNILGLATLWGWVTPTHSYVSFYFLGTWASRASLWGSVISSSDPSVRSLLYDVV